MSVGRCETLLDTPRKRGRKRRPLNVIKNKAEVLERTPDTYFISPNSTCPLLTHLEKRTAFSYRSMLFGVVNAPGTFIFFEVDVMGINAVSNVDALKRIALALARVKVNSGDRGVVPL
jgi:hypothetical protein